MGVYNPSEELQNFSYLNIFKMCMCIFFLTSKAREYFNHGRKLMEWGKFLPVVKCPISIWLHTGQPLISCFYTCLNQQRKLLNFFMVSEQFDSINSIYTTVKCGKVGSKAADGLQLPFTYELVYVHPCHLTRTLIVKVFPFVVCTHAMHV